METNGMGINLNWIRQHGTKKQQQALCGSGFTFGSKLTNAQHMKREKDIKINPKKYEK